MENRFVSDLQQRRLWMWVEERGENDEQKETDNDSGCGDDHGSAGETATVHSRLPSS